MGPHAGAPSKALVYDPPGTPRGGVVIVPGLALQAHEDPRLHNLAMGFTRGGFRGIVLEVPDISALRIRPETELDLAARLRGLLDQGLIPDGRLGLLGPSFSGSLALRAAARPEVAEDVRAVLTVGAFCDAARTVDFLFHHDDADPYGRMVLMLNFLHVVDDVSPELLGALRVAIEDTGRPADEALLPEALARLPEASRAHLSALLRDRAAWTAIGERMVAEGGPIFAAMSIPPIVERLGCHVFEMHGHADAVVPPSESVALHEALTGAGVPSRLVITSILDHADIQGGMRLVRESIGMIGGFAHFVEGMERSR